MAFFNLEVACPFCGSTLLNAMHIRSDEPPAEPSETDEILVVFCSKCIKKLFSVSRTFDKQIFASGVSSCKKCQKDLYNLNNKNWCGFPR